MPKLILVGLLCWISGCSSLMTKKENIMPKGSETMKAVYQEHVGQQHQQKMANIQLPPADKSDDLFPKVPNPDIRIYIDAHISAAEIPIPGYWTQVPLYRRNYYALPGEVTHD